MNFIFKTFLILSRCQGFHLTVEFRGWMEPVSWAIPGVWTDGSEWVRERRDSTGPGLLGISSHRSVFTLRTAKQPSVAGLILRAPHFKEIPR